MNFQTSSATAAPHSFQLPSLHHTTSFIFYNWTPLLTVSSRNCFYSNLPVLSPPTRVTVQFVWIPCQRSPCLAGLGKKLEQSTCLYSLSAASLPWKQAFPPIRSGGPIRLPCADEAARLARACDPVKWGGSMELEETRRWSRTYIPARLPGQSRSSRPRNHFISMSRSTLFPMVSKPLARKKSGLSAVAPPTAKLAPLAKSSALRPLRYGRTNGRPSVSAAATWIPSLKVSTTTQSKCLMDQSVDRLYGTTSVV
jgi:hypothetical protein